MSLRHINQITREELISKINEVEQEMYRVVSTDTIRWYELCGFKDTLTAEAKRRAKLIGTNTTAQGFGLVM